MKIENLNDVPVFSGTLSLEVGGALSGVALSDTEMRIGGDVLLRGESDMSAIFGSLYH